MENSARNPWLGLREKALKIRTPRQILGEQSDLLYEATNGVLRARIEVGESSGQMSQLRFTVLVPTLNNYTVGLFSVYQAVTQYPARLIPDWDDKAQPCRVPRRQELGGGHHRLS